MREVSENINTILSNDPDVAAIVGSKIYPMLANQDDEFPIIVFRVNDLGFVTKGGIREYIAEILCVAEEYDQVLTMAEKVEAAFQANQTNGRFIYQGANPGNELDQFMSIKMNFKIKK